jgi:hypothetical protein
MRSPWRQVPRWLIAGAAFFAAIAWLRTADRQTWESARAHGRALALAEATHLLAVLDTIRTGLPVCVHPEDETEWWLRLDPRTLPPTGGERLP